MPDSSVAITAGSGTPVDTRTQADGDHRQVVVTGDATSTATQKVNASGDAVASITHPSLAALGISAGITGYGNMRVTTESSGVFHDSFDSTAGLDTTNRWTTGGTAVPTIVTGAVTLNSAATANASSVLNSKPTFGPLGVNFLGMGWTGRFANQGAAVGTLFATGTHKFMGFGSAPTTYTPAYTAGSTTANPLLHGIGFEVDTDGAMYPVVYDNGTRTRPALLDGSANLNVNRTLANGQTHQFLLVIRADAIFWYVNGTNAPVAIYNYSTAGYSFPDVAAIPIRFASINTATVTGVAPVTRIGAVGVGDTGGTNMTVSDSTYPWRRNRVSDRGEILITDTWRNKQAVASLHSGRFTVLAAADAATAGRLWLLNPVGSTVLIEVRRVEFSSAPTAVTAFPSSPRVTVERVTFTGAPTGAALTPAVRDSTEAALVGTVRTASTGLTLTAGAAAYGFTVVPILTGVGAAVPSLQEWEPSEAGRIVLRAGQGIVIRQPDAGTTADTRSFNINLAWAEYTVPA